MAISGGGPGFGDVNIGVNADFSDAEEALEDFVSNGETQLTRLIKKFEQGNFEIVSDADRDKALKAISTLDSAAKRFEENFTRKGRLPPPEVEEFIARIRDASDNARELLGGIGEEVGPIKLEGVDKLNADMEKLRERTEKLERQLVKLQGEALKDDKLRKFLATLTPAQRAFAQTATSVEAAQKKVQAFAAAEIAAGKANEAFDIQQRQQHDTLGKSTGLLDKLNKKLQEHGLSLRNVSVLLGAGLATGLAGVVRISEVVGKAAAQFIGEEKLLAVQTELTFRGGADEIEKFANTTAGKLGASRDEALKTANSFAILGRQLQFPERAIPAFAQLETASAAAASRVVGGFKNTEDAGKAVEAAIRGDMNALASLGVTANNFARISRETFGKLPDQLTEAQTAIVATRAVAEGLTQQIEDFGLRSKSPLQAFKDQFKAAFGDIDVSQLKAVSDLVDHIAAGQNKQPTLLERFLRGGAGIGPPLDEANKAIKEFDSISTPILERFRDKLEKGANSPAQKALLKAIDEEIKRRKEEADVYRELLKLLPELGDAHQQAVDNFKNSGQAQQQALDLIIGLQRAMEDGNRRVAEAELQLARAREDNAKRSRDVAKRNKDALEDAAIAVDRAEQKLTDAREDRAFRDRQAAERTAEVILRAQRANRTAEENLADFLRESRRRVEDLRERIRRLQQQSRADLFDVHVQIINANLRGQNALANAASRQLANLARTSQGGSLQELRDAERDLAREQEDNAIKLDRLQRDVKETREDGIRDITKAQEEQDRVAVEGARAVRDAENAVTDAKRRQERAIRDAADAIADLGRENTRAIEDAQRAWETAVRERDRAIHDAERALEKFTTDMDLSIKDLQEVMKPLLDPKTQKALADYIEFIREVALRSTSPDLVLTAFASGGDVPANQAVRWNETVRNPRGELLITPSGGTVISHADFIRLLRLLEKGPVRGSDRQLVMNIFDRSGSPRATAWAVQQEIMRNL